MLHETPFSSSFLDLCTFFFSPGVEAAAKGVEHVQYTVSYAVVRAHCSCAMIHAFGWRE